MPKIKGPNSQTFKRIPNAQAINNIREELGGHFANRVPEANRANMETVMDAIFSFSGIRNDFINALVNVGVKMIGGVEFENPLSKYKRVPLSHGDRIEQTQIGLAKEYGYSPDRDYMEKDLLGREPLETMLAVHRVNRFGRYKITIDEVQLRRAFFDEFGISDFIAEIMKVPQVSNEVHEFEYMTSMFRHYYDRDGFAIVNVPDVRNLDSDEADAKALLRRIRAAGTNLRFVSRRYNAAKMPSAAKPEKLVLYVNADAQAAIDVEALAPMFNLSKGEVPFRVEVLPEDAINIPGAQAILSTEDFLMCADVVRESREFQNGAGLYTNHWLHIHQIVSVNPFVPAILFSSTDPSTVFNDEPVAVTGLSPIEVHDINSDTPTTALTTIDRSHFYQVIGSALGAEGVDEGVKLGLYGTTSALSYIRQDGGLHIGPDEEATEFTIQAISLADESVTAQVTIQLSEAKVDYWPNLAPAPEPEVPDEDEGETP